MHAMPSETLAGRDVARYQRLAAQLADMIPGAATIRVSLNDPKQQWPHPHAVVKNAAGETIDLNRTSDRIAARWILRVWPDLDWNRAHTFDLASATLTRSDLLAAGRSR
ncbi:transcriptional regulator [Streptacidiphilus sp. PB12-B1b]|uniref:transcriptional regulator n=1 Tax=Streptacidiphilus sp. PB12-B1b TaxID=2705012 RepID=UPI0015F79B60|nr:transcriptional regulator [Streptacidiphilus sp. PB12-B1b]QMU74766.1 transcriptional regulator [Streptacidiphilus sp. PB12-B1b]